jgi:hypothetical protein
MSDFPDDDDPERYSPDRATPTGRVYVHERCGGETHVSGRDFTHICDPFWLCTGTYCCTCAGFAPLREFYWVETEEPLSEYRSRLRAATPGPLKAWRYGLGFLTGGACGTVAGLLTALIVHVARNRIGEFTVFGGLIGAFACHILGTRILNRMCGVEYRRML